MTDQDVRRRARGRPVATSHAEIEQAAFELFGERGFERTTLDAIAERVGVGRRTLFRYYQSKNDIPWGQFDQTLAGFRKLLAAQPHEIPLHDAVHRAVVDFNRFPDNARPSHRDRMRLILTTPELRAHSVHQYAAWRAAIAEYVARRTNARPSDLVPRLIGQVSLALALTAYEVWLDDESADLPGVLDEGMSNLVRYLCPT
ncbi:mycofactocin system transcriptional regulator [Nocardioides immobilis]|uniref:Mycofactocin system transcriptional regulator n=1 Tax=Nocardioides immobilis TaxID=2049295 RepID=A0A417XTN9_9ACTN|nr:mycofactocin system transcriptional regulator [Nocardioides immobilis]RHW23822.1 mycofactocin system transcriptional regulator [Nocardioides immobilis]